MIVNVIYNRHTYITGFSKCKDTENLDVYYLRQHHSQLIGSEHPLSRLTGSRYCSIFWRVTISSVVRGKMIYQGR